MQNVFLGLGSNIGDRKNNIQQTISKIEHCIGEIAAQSSLYKTAAWGKTDQSYFINQVIKISTPLSPIDLLDQVLRVERQRGRIRKEKWGARSIDIDILFYGSEIIELPRLLIPHPFIAERRFVLAPMHELAPDFLHPVFERTIRELLTSCDDPLAVEKLT